MEVVDDPLCHICIAEDLASVFLHEDVAQDGTVDAKAHEGAQDIPVSDEAVPAVPFDGEEFDAKVYGAFIAAIDKGYFYSFSFVVTAEAFGRDGSRMRGNRLSDLCGKGTHKRPYSKRTAAVYRIGEIQQANGHVLCFFACCRKVAKNFFSIFHVFLNSPQDTGRFFLYPRVSLFPGHFV